MKIPLEEHLPYRLLALVVLVIFYTIYLLKCGRRSVRAFVPSRLAAERSLRSIEWKSV